MLPLDKLSARGVGVVRCRASDCAADQNEMDPSELCANRIGSLGFDFAVAQVAQVNSCLS